MYKYSIEKNLKKVLKKLFKKDRKRYEIVMKKIEEILTCKNPYHYKSLRYDLKRFKRVHINSHFVLLFSIEEQIKQIKFVDLDHHDKVYLKKY